MTLSAPIRHNPLRGSRPVKTPAAYRPGQRRLSGRSHK